MRGERQIRLRLSKPEQMRGTEQKSIFKMYSFFLNYNTRPSRGLVIHALPSWSCCWGFDRLLCHPSWCRQCHCRGYWQHAGRSLVHGSTSWDSNPSPDKTNILNHMKFITWIKMKQKESGRRQPARSAGCVCRRPPQPWWEFCCTGSHPSSAGGHEPGAGPSDQQTALLSPWSRWFDCWFHS